MSTSLRKTYILLSLVAASWGGAFVAGKYAVSHMEPFTVATLRFGIASLLLWIFLRIKEGGKNHLEKEDLPWLLLLGLTGIFSYNALFFMALQVTSAVNGALIIAANPMATTLISYFLLKEEISRFQLGGILLSFAGVVFVISKGSWDILAGLDFNHGDIYLLGSMLSWAIYSIAGKRVMKKFSPLAATTYACIFGTIALAPFMAWEFNRVPEIAWHGGTMIAITYMAVFASVIGFVWWYQGVSEIGASRSSIFVNLVPVAAMFIAALTGEALTWPQLVGATLVISGVYLTSKRKAVAISNPVVAEAK